MYTKRDIREEFNRLDRITGIDSSKIGIKIGSAVRRFGSYNFKRQNGKILEDSVTITKHILEDTDQFFDTVRHEYAHAVVQHRFPNEDHGHDALWCRTARECGANPERCASSESLSRARASQTKYTIVCDDCKRSWDYVRRGSFVKNLQNGGKLRCPCGGHNLRVVEW